MLCRALHFDRTPIECELLPMCHIHTRYIYEALCPIRRSCVTESDAARIVVAQTLSAAFRRAVRLSALMGLSICWAARSLCNLTFALCFLMAFNRCAISRWLSANGNCSAMVVADDVAAVVFG